MYHVRLAQALVGQSKHGSVCAVACDKHSIQELLNDNNAALVSTFPNNGVNIFLAKLFPHWRSPAVLVPGDLEAKVLSVISFFTGADVIVTSDSQ